MERFNLTDEQISNAFNGTNFGTAGETAKSRRALVVDASLKLRVGYSCGHTMKCILTDLGCKSPTGERPFTDASCWAFSENAAENSRLQARVGELEGLLREARSEILHMGDGATELTEAIKAALSEQEAQG